jgi:hypothetical protein
MSFIFVQFSTMSLNDLIIFTVVFLFHLLITKMWRLFYNFDMNSILDVKMHFAFFMLFDVLADFAVSVYVIHS